MNCARFRLSAAIGMLPIIGMVSMSGAQEFARDTQTAVDARLRGQAAGAVAGELRDSRSNVEPAPWSPRTDDIGEQLILKEVEKYRTFSAFADANLYATDNVALTSRGEQDDAYFVGQIGVSAQPKLSGSLFGEVTVRQQFYRYDEFDILDFNGLDAGAGLTYITEKLTGLALFTRYNYKRLTDASEDNEFFTSHTWKVGVQKPFILSRAHFIYVALSSDFALDAEPTLSRRHEHALDAGYFVNLTRSLSAQAYYRGAYYDYTEFGREAWNHIVGLTARYKFTDWLSAGVYASYTFNRSNFAAFDYDAGNVGGGLAINLKF